MIVSTLINGLWQGAAIVAIGYAVTLAVPQRNASTRYAIWFATVLALAVVPILSTTSKLGAWLLGALNSHSAAIYKVSLIPAVPLVARADAWAGTGATWIVSIWLAGVAICLLRLAASFVRVEGIARGATHAAGADADVFVSESVAVPIVAGIFSPKIVLPSVLATQLPPADLQRIIRHERAHVRRRDPFYNLIQRSIEALLFFNPWVHLAGRRVCIEREAACDDWVVEETGSAGEYAACLAALAQTIRRRSAALLTPSAFRSRAALVARIKRLDSVHRPRLTVNAFAVGGTIVLFIVATLALQALSPARVFSPEAQPGSQSLSTAVAAACANPDVEATVINAVPPELPHGFKAYGFVNVAVTIAPNGRVTHTSVLHSSGNATIDNAVVQAARTSTYSPKLANCTPVQGDYIFHAEFKPSP
jgi:TonB family protein